MRRAILALLLFTLAGFLGLGSGFALYWRLAYVVLLAVAGGFLWAWLNLQWLDLHLERRTVRAQVGTPLEGRIRVTNRGRLPKAWLEVEELTDLPQPDSGRVITLASREVRGWRHFVACRRRGIYHLGPVRVRSSDPFGLFTLSRLFLERHRVVVHPRAEPLPSFNLPMATVSSDGRHTERSLHLTTQAASVRPYVQGDSVKRVHWPYTARMGTLMVKEFDQGVSAQVWLLLDLQREVQVGDELDNTEEVAITVAASVAARLLSGGVPVGLAGEGDQSYLLRPDHSQGQEERLLELLATMKAQGVVPLERALYQLDPQLGRLSTLMVITPTTEMSWMFPLSGMRRRGVYAMAALIDPSSFGSNVDMAVPMERLQLYDVPTYVVRRGQELDEALRAPMNPPGPRVPSRMPVGLVR